MTDSRKQAQLNLESLEDRCTPAVVSSTFLSGPDGWTTTRDDNKGAGSTGLAWFANGGAPGGYVRATDKQDGHYWLWRAPAKYFGDHKDLYGQYLTFDARQSNLSQQFDKPDVFLTGKVGTSTVSLQLDYTKNPGNTFTSYAGLLSEKGGWTVVGTGNAPTEKEFKDVLTNVTKLLIRGEYSRGLSRGSLDNVRFGGEGPLLAIGNVVKFEGDQGSTAYQFNVALSHILATTVTVKFATADGTAKAGSDYTASSGQLTIAAGSRSGSLTVNGIGDTKVEATQRFSVVLSSATNAVIAIDTGFGVIVNDD